ncbi:TlpA disulfide reductase family protein [Eoetvoesiella caeni]|uniref:Peroxiredoxin n=1 Tax=Eoetvoesiella caeni TaxID=645616 RepID=A0A366H8H1_9BURK|nr:TlpA disulfide reductase family protein [Eoetvoesiella caeni]MCI2809766.1 TlpA family protein disulfide reductase [Eoetvoesiella caeni]NYT56319.1 TlpA family protein disulfide reductase [Eoetvoesiella caeni]RBP38377.1 peroxiredoxin [Eoetvoesiella caeni]
MKKALISLIAVVALAGLGYWQFAGTAKTAPDVVFTSLTGQQISTQDLRGKVVLVKFWATSCVTCIQQMPDTVQAYEDMSPKGYDVIAVAMQYDPPNYVKNYSDTRKLPFTVAIDSQGKIAKAFGDVQLTPTAFLIDKQGHIIKRYLGNYDKVAFRSTVEKALAG